MPQIAAPSLLPCPQAAPLSPVDRRLSSEEGKGPIVFRTLELAERLTQGLMWTLNAAQLAEFRAWWTLTLFYGGAWFAAPENWPNMEGRIVRKRRFIDAPKFTYLGAEMTRVEVTCEIRGEVVIAAPPPPQPSEEIFLDEFNGEGFVAGHEPDLHPDGFEWFAPDGESGLAMVSGVAVNVSDGVYNHSNFDGAWSLPLTANWRMEMIALMVEPEEGTPQAAWSVSTGGETPVGVLIQLNGYEEADGVYLTVDIAGQNYTSDSLPSGLQIVRVDITGAASAAVYVNNVLLTTIAGDFSGFVSLDYMEIVAIGDPSLANIGSVSISTIGGT